MLTLLKSSRGQDAILNALDRSLAVIEFDRDGNILRANANFCSAMGYAESELRGRHHSMFVAPDYAKSGDYADFWARLRRGEYEARASIAASPRAARRSGSRVPTTRS